MNWSEAAWAQGESVYKAILEMPFIQEQLNGTLDIEKFKFYIAQDSNYLEQFGRALALIGARAHSTEHVLRFIRFAEGAIVVEKALHADYFAEFGIEGKAPISPVCHHYTNFLLKEAALSQVEIAMAAVLPCFRIYKKVGDYIYEQQSKEKNPYQTWIDTYAGEEFGLRVQEAIAICDAVAATCTAAQQQKMTEAFVTGCKLEWLFWDSAWRLEKW
ncbi:MAG: thiaminase II [Janthinobacterium lividum]